MLESQSTEFEKMAVYYRHIHAVRKEPYHVHCQN